MGRKRRPSSGPCLTLCLPHFLRSPPFVLWLGESKV